jgi:hypothetical protein
MSNKAISSLLCLVIFLLVLLVIHLWTKRKKHIECEPQEALEDGFCNWVCPKPTGYLMQCCDCGLVHEVDFRVAKYKTDSSDEFEVVEDKNTQVQFRMRRYE